MAFTKPVITHTFENPTGTPASGSVIFTLLNRMTNGAKTLIPGTVSATLTSTGALSQALTANLDAGTLPNTTQWRVDLKIIGDEQQNFQIIVPPVVVETNGTTSSSTTVTLSTTTASQSMVGQSITGTNIPASTVITGWTTTTTKNQVTISNAATGSGSGLTLTIGATIDLGYLLPGNQQIR